MRAQAPAHGSLPALSRRPAKKDARRKSADASLKFVNLLTLPFIAACYYCTTCIRLVTT